ncbi:hypothetical protein K432DRAFT_442833 [Lepidopterella palustris CBS 459.81]|uniref:Zn(2)-C6 fungal-type domain-containing protein n=1 Tax=Lepidopterella palustris CBS 459.81 TaxID=1314670 RepID=A0A8E2EBP7_9PEZI|nr:hypothetical protein K432DRAFT_442833 [Lepidopterella palustris CBS 459.81]
MSVPSPASRSLSPDASPNQRAGKKRKVLSCYPCRNRKMKCDRVFPVCGRCGKTGRGNTCTYDPRLMESFMDEGPGHSTDDGPAMEPRSHNSPNTPGLAVTQNAKPPADSITWKFRMQERRIEKLEKKLSELDGNRDGSYPTPLSAALDDIAGTKISESSQSEVKIFRGKGFKTQFYGSTSSLGLFSQLRELRLFTEQVMATNSSMSRIKSDFKAFRTRRKAANAETPSSQYTHAEILALIPDKSAVDELVSLYFQHFETTYRILHIPSFWKGYRSFWKDPSKSPPGVVVTILLVMAAARCLSSEKETSFIGDSSSGRHTAMKWIEAAEAWLHRHSQKHLTLEYFQVQCLALLAKQVNCIKVKQEWVQAGELVRLAMASGMHRDPSLLAAGKTSEFEKEMRRRIWATMVEMELQASIEKGLPSSISGLDFDCPAPANTDDESFSPESPSPPTSEPIEHYTPTSYLHACRHTLALRTHLTTILNSPTGHLEYTDILHYDTKLTTALSCLPPWNHPANPTSSILPRTLLALQLLQLLLILHHPFTKLAPSNSRYAYSVTAGLSAASTILSLHTALVASGLHSLNMLRNDVFRAAICVSCAVYAAIVPRDVEEKGMGVHGPSNPLKYTEARGEHELAPPSAQAQLPPHSQLQSYPPSQNQNPSAFVTDDFFTRTLCNTALPLLDTALEIFEHKMMRLGTGYMEYWLMCAAQGVLPSLPSNPLLSTAAQQADLKSRGQRAVEKITRLCYKVLALQGGVSGGEFGEVMRLDGGAAQGGGVGLVGGGGGANVVMQEQGTGEGEEEDRSAGSDGMDMEGEMHGFGDGLDDLGMGSWTWMDFWAFDVGEM